jgi:hypothetical protein
VDLTNGETINIVVAKETSNDDEEEQELLHLFDEYCIAQSYSYRELVMFQKLN